MKEGAWKRIKVPQPKPANHWRQQCEKWQKSIQHFNLSPLKDVGKKGWLRSSRSLNMEEQPDNWREKSSASNSIIRWALLQTLCCVYALWRRPGGDREKYIFVGVFKSSEEHMRCSTTKKSMGNLLDLAEFREKFSFGLFWSYFCSFCNYSSGKILLSIVQEATGTRQLKMIYSCLSVLICFIMLTFYKQIMRGVYIMSNDVRNDSFWAVLVQTAIKLIQQTGWNVSK